MRGDDRDDDEPFNSVRKSTSDPGDLPRPPDDVSHYKVKDRDDKIREHIIVWEEPEEGLWIRASPADIENLSCNL